MRVSSNSYAQILNSLSNLQAKQQDNILQLTTGLRVNKPSDDPAAAASVIANNAAQDTAAQYESNISSTQALAQSASSALASVVTSLNSAISAATSVGNGDTSASQRGVAADSITAIRDQVISLANTSMHGVYLFAGTASDSAPFALDSSSADGVSYSGNSGVNEIPVGNDASINANVPGDQIFTSSDGNVMKALTNVIDALNADSTDDLATALVSLQDAVETVSLQQQYYSDLNNQLENQNSYLESATVSLKSQENDLVGADTTKVITDITQGQVSTQAALSAIAKVSSKSLIDYL